MMNPFHAECDHGGCTVGIHIGPPTGATTFFCFGCYRRFCGNHFQVHVCDQTLADATRALILHGLGSGYGRAFDTAVIEGDAKLQEMIFAG
jgi:hypothetical protein